MKTAIVALLLATAIASPANAGERVAWSTEYFQSEAAREYVRTEPAPVFYPEVIYRAPEPPTPPTPVVVAPVISSTYYSSIRVHQSSTSWRSTYYRFR